jgi:hypothetical protein
MSEPYLASMLMLVVMRMTIAALYCRYLVANARNVGKFGVAILNIVSAPCCDWAFTSDQMTAQRTSSYLNDFCDCQRFQIARLDTTTSGSDRLYG